MQTTWWESIRSGFRVTRRRRDTLGALQALESRALLSAVGMGQATASAGAPRIYGPFQLSTSDSETSAADVTPAAEPAPPPLVPEDYNGSWDVDSSTVIKLQINSKATKIKGTIISTVVPDFKLKGKLDGLQVTATAKGKVKSPVAGKYLVNLSFALTDPDHWEGTHVTFLNKQVVSSGGISAIKAP